MSAKRIEFHQGAIADVQSAVVWYKKRSPKAASDFIQELRRAVATIREARNVGQSQRTRPDDFSCGDSRLPSSIRNKNP